MGRHDIRWETVDEGGEQIGISIWVDDADDPIYEWVHKEHLTRMDRPNAEIINDMAREKVFRELREPYEVDCPDDGECSVDIPDDIDRTV